MRHPTLLRLGHPAFASATLGLSLTALVAGCTGSGSNAGASSTASPAAVASAPSGSASDAGASQLRPQDVSALKALVASGGNRACSHTIESEIKVPTLADGNAISGSLQSDKYLVRVAQNAQGSGVLVIVDQDLVPSDSNIVTMAASMDRIAKAHHGTFDRWETTPVKTC